MSKHMTAEDKAKWCIANNCALEDFSIAYKARSEMLSGFDNAHYDVPRKLLKKWKKAAARKRHYKKANAYTGSQRGIIGGSYAYTNVMPSPHSFNWERS